MNNYSTYYLVINDHRNIILDCKFVAETDLEARQIMNDIYLRMNKNKSVEYTANLYRQVWIEGI